MRLWDTRTGHCLHTWQDHTSWVLSMAWSPDGQTFATGSFDLTGSPRPC
ncbi:WD40 repeat domain-containing protein [Dendronalium sp. ChiSLP03b]